jgi:hypothetical protein
VAMRVRVHQLGQQHMMTFGRGYHFTAACPGVFQAYRRVTASKRVTYCLAVQDQAANHTTA